MREHLMGGRPIRHRRYGFLPSSFNEALKGARGATLS